MRVAIAGAGNVGLFIANDLRAADHDVLIIEQNPAVVKRAQSADGIEWHVADCCEVNSLPRRRARFVRRRRRGDG